MDGTPAAAKAGWFQGSKSKVVVLAVVAVALLLLAGGGVGVGIGVQRHKDRKRKSSPASTTAAPATSRPATPGNTTAGTNGTVVEAMVYCPLPATKPGENRTQILQPVSIGTSNATAYVKQANKFVSFFLDEGAYYVGIDYLTQEVLLGNRNMLVRYLSTCRSDAVVNVTNELAEAPRKLPNTLVLRITLKMAVVLVDFGKWLAGNPEEYRTLSPAELDTLDAFQARLDALVAAEAPEPYPEDPLQQLAFYTARLTQYGVDIGIDTAPESGRWLQMLAKAGRKQRSVQMAAGRRMKAANATSIQHNLGLPSFSRAKIGIVFHAIQYVDRKGRLQPLVAQQNAPTLVERLVEAANGFYELSGANMEFYVKEYRYNVTQFPYLRADNRTIWQECAAEGAFECHCTLAKRHNVEPTKYINIFIVGSYGEKPYLSGVGSTSSLPYEGDFCPDADFIWNQTIAAKTQHLWLAYDVLDPESSWVNNRYSEGAGTLAHELGHFLGLLHTHNLDCESAYDYVPDTPPELNSQEQSWFYELYYWCADFKSGLKPATAALKKFNTCRGDKFVDNLFNIMSYTAGPCNLYFTVGQVRRMQTIAMHIYKDMLVPV